jgi:phosphoribosyl-ATP pyrophosphohydrolase
MRRFPQPNYVLNKVAEESGEVIKAVIHYTEGREQWSNVNLKSLTTWLCYCAW